MTKSLNTLRKLEKTQVDKASILLNRLRNNQNEIRNKKAQLHDKVHSERNNTFEDDPSLSIWLYQGFLISAKREMESMSQQIEAIEKDIKHEEANLIKHYRGMKKYENLIDKKEREQKELFEKDEFTEREDITQSRYVIQHIQQNSNLN